MHLRTNLTRMGATIPEGAVAHHVVGNSLFAQATLHPILKKLGFDLNDAANGIMLDKTFHEMTLGTNSYRSYVITRLGKVDSLDSLLQILDEIKAELLSQQKSFKDNGTLPQWPACKATDN